MKKFTASWTRKEVELNDTNLTALETSVMLAARNNEYGDCLEGGTWTFTVFDNSDCTSDRQFGGVCSSLIRKGYINVFTEGEDGYFNLTEAGKKLFSDYTSDEPEVEAVEEPTMEERLVTYLQSMMDSYKKDEAKYGFKDEAVQDKLDAMIACKEMAEALIGKPVNLQRNGVVTVGLF